MSLSDSLRRTLVATAAEVDETEVLTFGAAASCCGRPPASTP
ncbi:hypothetical protein [Phycicoccus sp. Root101]|nr:hypothetical protein [Phycicoccus sp. Root101]